MFDAYEGFDTIHKVPNKLQWSIYAYAMAALVQPYVAVAGAGAGAGASSANIDDDSSESADTYVFADGHYISWANSYSYVTSSAANPLDNDSYLDRPTGLLTCTDVAWLQSAMDGADASVSSVVRISGPTMVYDRGALETVMSTHPDDNVNEWVDEQMGLVLKYGFPLMKVMRIEDGVHPAAHSDGVILSVPATASTELVANLTLLSSTGATVVLLGRCDKIVRCPFSIINLHSRMPLSFTPLLRLKQTGVRLIAFLSGVHFLTGLRL
jgi:hypothetical protein